MANSTTTLIGVFDDRETAQRVRQDLASAGIAAQIAAADMIAGDAARGGTGLTGERHRVETHGGGIAGFFRSLFGSDEPEEADVYSEVVTGGGVAVTATVDDDSVEKATDIMNRNKPVDIDQRLAGIRQDAARRREPGPPQPGADRVIPVVEEQLQVGKRAVRRGGIRIINRITETPVEEQVNLREERVRVDRRPADRPASGNEFITGQDAIELTETVEEPVVSKQARVVEEVVIGKEATQRTETVHGTVRRTDVEVQGLDRDADYSADFRRNFDDNYAKSGQWSDYQPAYQYGYRMASDPNYKGRSWSDVESQLKTDYLRNNPNSTWDNIKGAVRYGWERVTGQRPSGTSYQTGAAVDETDFRRDYDERYSRSGQWNDYQPAYQYGYRMASDPNYKGRNWSDVESQLKTDYLRNNPNSKWDNIKGAVRYGWEKVSGKR